MKILDANIILRYIIEDKKEMADIAEKIITENTVYLLPEVIAEVVFVVTKFYKMPRETAVDSILMFMEDCKELFGVVQIIKKGLVLFKETSLDFVDCLLCAYHTEDGFEICTFDKKLNKLIAKKDKEKFQTILSTPVPNWDKIEHEANELEKKMIEERKKHDDWQE